MQEHSTLTTADFNFSEVIITKEFRRVDSGVAFIETDEYVGAL